LRRQSSSQQDSINRQRDDQNSGQKDHQWRSQLDKDQFSNQSHGSQNCLIKLHHELLYESLLHEEGLRDKRPSRTFQVRHHKHHRCLLLSQHVPQTCNIAAIQLNPVIGETLQASYPDGTQVYCEQVSHHPPISYFLAVGPENSYRYYGCYNFSAHAGLNSMQLVNKGHKVYEFANGDIVNATFNK